MKIQKTTKIDIMFWVAFLGIGYVLLFKASTDGLLKFIAVAVLYSILVGITDREHEQARKEDMEEVKAMLDEAEAETGESV